MTSRNGGALIIVLPHQDDEIFVNGFILSRRNGLPSREKYRQIHIIYLTHDTKSIGRKSECKKYLGYLFSTEVKIIFLGEELGIAPRGIFGHRDEVRKKLYEIFREIKKEIDAIDVVFPEFEYGHIDHDVVNLICHETFNTHASKKFVYSSYSYSLVLGFFPKLRIMQNLQRSNSETREISRFDLLKMNWVGFQTYRSQRGTWLKLGAGVQWRTGISPGRNWKRALDSEIPRYPNSGEFPKLKESHHKFLPKWASLNYRFEP